MATHQGNSGTVTVSSSAIGELTAWSLTLTSGQVETTKRGNTHRTYEGGFKDASGSITAHFDKANAQQNACAPGATVALLLRFDDGGTGTHPFSGNALITEETARADISDQLTEISWNFVNVDDSGITQS